MYVVIFFVAYGWTLRNEKYAARTAYKNDDRILLGRVRSFYW